MFKSNVFDLQINKKIKSESTERVLGCYFYHHKMLHYCDNKDTHNIKCITDKRLYMQSIECEYFIKILLGQRD